VTGEPSLSERLARAFDASRLGDSQSPEVVTVSVQEDGRPAEPVVVRLTARQAWWLCVRLGVNRAYPPAEESTGGDVE
jgi:hypothetical protein